MAVVSTGSHSAELSYVSNTHIDAELKIRPLRDQIVVEPLPVEHSRLIDVIEHTKPLRGIVKAVGPGCYPWRYDHPDKHKRTRMWRSQVFVPTELKVGDIVELGGYQEDDRGNLHMGFAFQQFIWGSKMHIICREVDVCGIVENVLTETSENEQTEQNQESRSA